MSVHILPKEPHVCTCVNGQLHEGSMFLISLGGDDTRMMLMSICERCLRTLDLQIQKALARCEEKTNVST